MNTYRIEKVDTCSLFVVRAKDCLYYYIFVSYDKYDNGKFSVAHKSKVKCMYLTQLIYRYRNNIKLDSYHLQDFIAVYREMKFVYLHKNRMLIIGKGIIFVLKREN